jgi:hypothetical protein
MTKNYRSIRSSKSACARENARKRASRLAAFLCLLYAACVPDVFAQPANSPPAGVISGQVLSGDTPVIGTHVTLYGSFAKCVPDPCFTVSLAAEETTTDAKGAFSLDLSQARATTTQMGMSSGRMLRDVQASPANGTLYLVASGGNAGRGANQAIKLVSLLGSTPLPSHVVITELTTVIALFSAGRAVRFPSFSSDSFSLFRSLVDLSSGRLHAVFYGGENSPAVANSLADVLHACVASDGEKSKPCSDLFQATSPIAFDRKPHDTLDAIWSIVLHPERDPRTIFNLIPPAAPYQPVVKTPPRGWLLTLNFTGGGLNHPTSILADARRNALWIINSRSRALSELSSDPDKFGSSLAGAAGLRLDDLREPSALWLQPGTRVPPPGVGPIGPNTPRTWVKPDALWVADRTGNSIEILTLDDDGHISNGRISGNGLSAPVGLAGYPNNEVYRLAGNKMTRYAVIAALNAGADRVSFFTAKGDPCGPPLQGLGLKNPQGIGTYGDTLLIANTDKNDLVLVKPPDANCNDARLAGTLTGGALDAPQYVAGGTVTNRENNSVVWVEGYGTQPIHVSGSPAVGGGLDEPEGITSAGSSAWVANHAPGADSITWLCGSNPETIYGHNPSGTCSGPHGFSGAGVNRPYGIAADNMGNLWVSNEGNDSVTVFIGPGHSPM